MVPLREVETPFGCWLVFMIRRVALKVLLITMVACGDSGTAPNQDGAAPIKMDALSYQLSRAPFGFDAEAVAVFVNRSSADVHFKRCTPAWDVPTYWVIREPPDTTLTFVGGAFACVGGVPTGRLAVGDSLVLAVWLGSSESPRANPPILMEHRTGLFRIFFDLCVSVVNDSDECQLVPPEKRRSNLFHILPP